MSGPAALTLSPRPGNGRRRVLERRVRLLVAATIAYNVVEAVIALGAGVVASSTALIAFGLDSVIEVSSAAAVAWQFSARDPEARERTALRVIAFSFFALATYVTVDASRALLTGAAADASRVGVILASVSVLIMPTLSLIQLRTGRELGSRTAVADSKQTMLCAAMSGVLLVGLLLNSSLGWAWADPLAGLVIAGLAVREGVEAWRGDACCASAGRLLTVGGAQASCDDDCCTDHGDATGPAPGVGPEVHEPGRRRWSG